MHFTVISISVFPYACDESSTFAAAVEKRTRAFEIRCYRRFLNVTNEHVRRKIQAAIGESIHDKLHNMVKKRKVRYQGPLAIKGEYTGYSQMKKKKKWTDKGVGRQY